MNFCPDVILNATTPEKSQKQKLWSDPCKSNADIEVASFSNEENLQFTERDFEDNSAEIQNKISK